MKIALLFGLFTEDNIEQISIKSKGYMQNAANTLQQSFMKGIDELFDDVELFNFPFIGSFPKHYKNLFYSSLKKENNMGKIKVNDNSFMNLSLVKYFHIYYKAKLNLQKWAENSSEDKVIIIYSIDPTFISAAVSIKSKFPKIKICLIVPDLPEGMSHKNSFIFYNLQKLYYSFVSKFYPKIDYYIFLSKYMSFYFNIKNIKYEVIEGIYDSTIEKKYFSNIQKESNTIMYCGSLCERYGVLNLIYAFHLLKGDNYKLVICGYGDAISKIEEMAKQDSRICFLGRVSHQKVLNLLSSASLLVNPRTPEGEYTKYSFPSKTMEYLASGTPTLLYKLKGIPEEYYKYCFAMDKFEGIQKLSFKIKEILDMDTEELNKIGMSARRFILNEKNPKSQCMKLYNMLYNKN